MKQHLNQLIWQRYKKQASGAPEKTRGKERMDLNEKMGRLQNRSGTRGTADQSRRVSKSGQTLAAVDSSPPIMALGRGAATLEQVSPFCTAPPSTPNTSHHQALSLALKAVTLQHAPCRPAFPLHTTFLSILFSYIVHFNNITLYQSALRHPSHKAP